MAQPTALGLLDIALINRARLDPVGEAARYGIDLNEGLFPGTISATSKQPLAFSGMLVDSAIGHSQSMIDNDYFAHNDPTDGSTPFTRITDSGYNWSTAGENIAANGTTGTLQPSVEVPKLHENLFVDHDYPGRGHRTNMLSDSFSQIGTGLATGVTTKVFNGTYNTIMVTEDYAAPLGGGQFLTGIAYNDADANAFYSVGEGRSGISITTSSDVYATGTAGGYSGAIGAGAQMITFSGGDLSGAVSLQATIMAGRNALIDIVGQSRIETSTSVRELSGVSKITGLGTIGLHLTAAGGGDTVIGALGNDTLKGGAGNDLLKAGVGADKLIGGYGADTLAGDGGADVLQGNKGGDRLVGGGSNDKLFGGNGNDQLLSGIGRDHLMGGSGADTLKGGTGNDTLIGGAGKDVQTGGPGHDTFKFLRPADTKPGARHDKIADFVHGVDHIGLVPIDAVSGGGNDAFTFIGNAAFSGTAGELRTYDSGGHTFIAGNVNSDRVANFEIELTSIVNLDAGDFFL